MKLEMKKDGKKLTVVITGSIDTLTAPELENELKSQWKGITELVLNFGAVDYISSAGLRVMMAADQYIASTDGKMSILNASNDVREVFEMTGFDELLNLE